MFTFVVRADLRCAVLLCFAMPCAALPRLGFDAQPFPVPREMTVEDIRILVEQFRQGAVNSIEAGFDGVEVSHRRGNSADICGRMAGAISTQVYVSVQGGLAG